MRSPNIEIVAAPSVRRSLTTPGDIKTEIDFQNDINNLLARIEHLPSPWKAAARLMSYDVAPRSVAQRRRNSVASPLRVLDGGAGGPQATDTASIEDAPLAAVQPDVIRRDASNA
jgi:hypothetical protein